MIFFKLILRFIIIKSFIFPIFHNQRTDHAENLRKTQSVYKIEVIITWPKAIRTKKVLL